jgi:hypothetical protein
MHDSLGIHHVVPFSTPLASILHLMILHLHLIGDISPLPFSMSRIGRSLLLIGVRTAAPLIAPLISLIPAARVAVVPSYPILLVCIISICDWIVFIFRLSFNMHSKNTNELVLRDNIVFHFLRFSAARIGP